MNDLNNENISISFTEDEIFNNVDLNKLLNEMDEKIKESDESFLPKYVNYDINYTLKQLLLICDYYDITKSNKLHKCNKDQIIQQLLIFENNPENTEIVLKRLNAWFYMNELKNDKFMKKYIIW